MPFRDFVISGIQTPHGNFIGGPILGSGMFMPEFTSALSDPETSQGGHPNVHYTVGAAAAELEVDKQTGRMRVLKAVAGRGRRQGDQSGTGAGPGGRRPGAGLGDGALRGHPLSTLKGKLLNANFTDYKIPTALDVPDEIVPIIVEVRAAGRPVRGARGRRTHHDPGRADDRQRGGGRRRPAHQDHADHRRKKVALAVARCRRQEE